MDDTAMRELAQHIRRTHQIREDSWMAGYTVVRGRTLSTGAYMKSLDQAMADAMVPEILHPIVLAILTPGYADVYKWCDRILSLYGEDVSAPAQFELI
jgi:hypothetical protein